MLICQKGLVFGVLVCVCVFFNFQSMSRSKIICAAKQVQRCNEKMATLLELGKAKKLS